MNRWRRQKFLKLCLLFIVCNPQAVKERQKRGGGESQAVNIFLTR